MGCINLRDKVISFEDCEMIEIKIESEPKIIRVSEQIPESELVHATATEETETETDWETV